MDERWERLFADLENQGDGAPDEDEISALVEAERVAVTLADRLAGSLGSPIRAVCEGTSVSGTLTSAGDGWVVISEQRADWILPLEHVAALSPLAAPRPAPPRSLTLAGVLRRIVGLPVQLGIPWQLTGRIVGVGADHLDVLDDAGRPSTVPLAALRSVRLRGGSLADAT